MGRFFTNVNYNTCYFITHKNTIVFIRLQQCQVTKGESPRSQIAAPLRDLHFIDQFWRHLITKRVNSFTFTKFVREHFLSSLEKEAGHVFKSRKENSFEKKINYWFLYLKNKHI